jgi:hypothetical protein
MSLQINANSAPVKALGSSNREKNLLPFAVDQLSSASRFDKSEEQESSFGMAGTPAHHGFGKSQNLSKPIDAFTISYADNLEASPGGLARMGGLIEPTTNAQTINPENTIRSIKNALFDKNKDAGRLLSIQANQAPNSVMKLLE